MQKRILAFLLALALVSALTACGQSPAQTPQETQTEAAQTTAAREAEGDIASPQQAPQTTQAAEDAATQPVITPSEAPAKDADTGPLFRKFVREKVADGTYTLRTEQAGIKVAAAADGADSAIESDAAGILHFSLIHRGDAYFMVMHTTKKYTKMSEAEYKKQVSDVGSTTVNLDNMRFRESGSENLGGTQYSTETYDEGDQGVVTYFFDGTGVRRTRVVKDGKTSLTDVFTVAADADASMFEIPTDYTLVSEPAQLLS